MKIFYVPQQSCAEAASYSPSAGKPALVVADWLKHGLITPDDIVAFEPLQDAVIGKAHAPRYVAGILHSRIPNGFGNTSEAVANSLLYTSGSLLAATEYALEHQTHTCSPTSGFHHAGYDFSEGFCTFNGLMVTAVALKSAGNAKSIGILDCDFHHGNGTEDIIKRLEIDYVTHFTQGAVFRSKDNVGKLAHKYFDWLKKAIGAMQDCDVILYQAGADPHEHDPLGGLLTTDQMQERDMMVFTGFKDLPLAWNLAGGYQRDAQGTIEPVLELHRNTVTTCLKYSHSFG